MNYDDIIQHHGVKGMRYAEERERKRALATDMQRKIYGLGNHDNIMKLKANKDVKIAPNKTAREVFSNLYNNDQSFNRAAKVLAVSWI